MFVKIILLSIFSLCYSLKSNFPGLNLNSNSNLNSHLDKIQINIENKLSDLTNVNQNTVDYFKFEKVFDNIDSITENKLHEILNLNENIIMNIKKIEINCNDIKHEINYNIIKIISSILPHVDTIGHKILHLDDLLINDIMNSTVITSELKKNIILNIIKLSQHGDNFGTHMLQTYYDIIDKLM